MKVLSRGLGISMVFFDSKSSFRSMNVIRIIIGNKVKGFNSDKKQGLQVSEKQKVSPWDILEGHKNPAPLSWTWFGAVKYERKPSRLEESFMELKYANFSNLEKPNSYFLEVL